MFTVISRIVHFGFLNFWRNGWLSVATVAVMVLALLVFIGLILFNVVTDQAILSIQEKIDIAVYFKTTAPEDEILKIKQAIEGLDQVKSVEYISRDEALAIFKEAHKDDPTITQALLQLEENPLEASLRIKAKESNQYESIANYLGSAELKDIIDEISYFKNQDAINRLNVVIYNINRGGLVLTLIMALIAGLMVFNTVWIAIYSSRDEIAIMRAVGASNVLVRGPYMVEGIIAGVFAAVLSLVVAAPFIHLASPFITRLIPELNLLSYFYANIGKLLFYQFLFGTIVGSLSSFLAVRRHLKN